MHVLSEFHLLSFVQFHTTFSHYLFVYYIIYVFILYCVLKTVFNDILYTYLQYKIVYFYNELLNVFFFCFFW